MPKKYDGIASNTLSLTQLAWPNVERDLSASSALNLTDYTVVQHKIKTSSSFLDLQQQVSTQNIIYLFVSNSLDLSQNVDRDGTLNVDLESQLDFTHKARSALHVERIEHQLELTHEAILAGRPIYIAAFNNLSGAYEAINTDTMFDVDVNDPEALEEYIYNLGLRHEISLEGSVHNVTAQSFLSLSHSAAPTKVGIASNHLHLSHSVELVLYEVVENIIYFQQEAICHKVYGVEQTLELSHEVVLDGDFPRSASNQLELKSVVSYVIINFCDYAPGVGAGTFEYTVPSVIVPTLVRRSTTVLTWPYLSPNLTVELRNPNFDNIEQFEFRRINRRTKGGSLDLYRDESWPKVERLIMSFTFLSDRQRADLFKFLQQSIGQEVGLLDYESRQWKGLLLTPTSTIAQPKWDGHSFSLEFEGELV